MLATGEGENGPATGRGGSGVWRKWAFAGDSSAGEKGDREMNNIFYIIGVVVVVLFILGYFGLR